jgi:L-cysteate sulfo-lyase
LDHVVVAFGSGATMAGLVAGLGPERVIGIDTGAVADPCGRLNELLDGMPDVRVRRADLQLDGSQVGAGYAVVTPAAREAMRLAARTDGIFLDPTYTARALAGLIVRVASGRIRCEDRTVSCTPEGCRDCSVIRTSAPDRSLRTRATGLRGRVTGPALL